MNYVDYVYDVTVAYEDENDIIHSELDMILRGKLPKKVHFNVRKHKVSELPADNQGRADWLTNIWEQKERKLKK